jgi:hypothetical protein
MVDLHTGRHRSAVLSCLRYMAQGWHLIGLRGLLSPRSLRGQCGMTALARAGVLGRARSFPVSPRGRVTPGFKNKTRYTPYVSQGSQISHIATNKGNIK